MRRVIAGYTTEVYFAHIDRGEQTIGSLEWGRIPLDKAEIELLRAFRLMCVYMMANDELTITLRVDTNKE